MCVQCKAVVSDSQNTHRSTNTMLFTLTPSPTTAITAAKPTDKLQRSPCTRGRLMEKIQLLSWRLRCTMNRSLVSSTHRCTMNRSFV